MRTTFLKVSQHQPLLQAHPNTNLISRYGQLLLYLAALGIIAYLYVLASGLILQYLSDLSLGATPVYK